MSEIDSYVKTYEIANKLYHNYKTINEKIPTINSGGCGIFAEYLYSTLKRFGLKPKLGVITNSIKGLNYRIKVWKTYGEDRYDLYGNQFAIVEHVVVILENKLLVDSTGVYDNLKQHSDSDYHNSKLNKRLTLETLKDWNRKGEFWNETFDRDYERVIEDKLDKCYNKVKKSLVVSNK